MSGFIPCVVVDVEDDDVVCVLLDDIDVRAIEEYECLSRHDLLLVKRLDVLHPEFSENLSMPSSAVLH